MASKDRRRQHIFLENIVKLFKQVFLLVTFMKLVIRVKIYVVPPIKNETFSPAH